MRKLYSLIAIVGVIMVTCPSCSSSDDFSEIVENANAEHINATTPDKGKMHEKPGGD